MEEWFEMVQKKTKLVRQESELVYELKDLELVEQHENLDKEIRKRISKDGKSIHPLLPLVACTTTSSGCVVACTNH